ncbi:MAG: nucleotide exchange factor GrpE [Planctomycetota bacterium]|jgi:molecular chaperone GrpE (heat shock protein)
MFKKFVIPGLVLLLAGSAVLGWTLLEKNKEQQKAVYYKSKYGSEHEVYIRQYTEWLKLPPEQRVYLPWALDSNGKPKTEKQLLHEQQERLKADLEKLAAGKRDTYPFADVLYGENWQEKLRIYKKQKARRETVFTASVLCMFAGGAILTCGLLLWVGRKLTGASSNLKESDALLSKEQKENNAKQRLQDGPKTGAIASLETEKWLGNIGKTKTQLKVKDRPDTKEKAKVEEKTKTQEKAKVEEKTKTQEKAKVGEKTKTQEKARVERDAAKEAESPAQRKKREDESGKDKKHSQGLRSSGFKNAKENTESKGDKNLKDSLKAQTENLEKQMVEFRQMAKGVRQTAIESSQPINSTLNELSQQVSAIREYASSQQDRLKKLQDGYDWNIMRTFCLRFIRCIDNLDKRISQMTKKDIKVLDLQEVRDELLFALESSGVEQYEPEINSDYHGQEKYAEAVKEKENCDDKKRAGKIAKVIRPAYQYFIDDENAKVVRPAQVKLFG